MLSVLSLTVFGQNAKAEPLTKGLKSLFAGHSFFKPMADGMPNYVAAAGITGHTQTVVFNGGANGAPQALWENASKKAQIMAALDVGDVELFVMTYHTDYPTTQGYENWIGYALAQNPSTAFGIALPWIPYPASFDAATYDALYTAYQPHWHDWLDGLRALFPKVDIFSIPYGNGAVELRNLLEVDNLPDVQALIGAKNSAIFTDSLGHPGNILRDVGRPIFLQAIYGVDLSTYSYGPAYSTDLNMIADSIMGAHDPAYNAAYLTDSDADGVGDAIDNCPITANTDQLDTDDNGRGDVCEELPSGC